MRNLVLVLALANLGILALFAWFVDAPSPSPAYDGAGITLLREIDPNTPIARSVAAVPQVAAALPDNNRSLSGDALSQPGDEANLPNPDDSAPAQADAPAIEFVEPAELTSTELATEAIAAVEQTEISGTEFGRCVSIGPFPADAVADSAFEILVDAGFDPEATVREVEVWDGYWVYIGQLGNLAAARIVQAELAEDGLDDTQIVSTADNGNLLSLGVFSEITRAGAQAERVNRIGYEATIADNLALAETRWLDVTLNSQQSLELDLLQAPGQISRLEVLDCEPQQEDDG